MVDISPIFGLMGSICAATIFFPQLYRSWKIKRTQDLSWFLIIIGVLSGISWSIYGIMKSDPFIYLTNITVSIGGILLAILKRKYG
jgi:uncharacterized protein with PQ loop repeat